MTTPNARAKIYAAAGALMLLAFAPRALAANPRSTFTESLTESDDHKVTFTYERVSGPHSCGMVALDQFMALLPRYEAQELFNIAWAYPEMQFVETDDEPGIQAKNKKLIVEFKVSDGLGNDPVEYCHLKGVKAALTRHLDRISGREARIAAQQLAKPAAAPAKAPEVVEKAIEERKRQTSAEEIEFAQIRAKLKATRDAMRGLTAANPCPEGQKP